MSLHQLFVLEAAVSWEGSMVAAVAGKMEEAEGAAACEMLGDRLGC